MEAFQPFGRLQSVKLLRDKGGELPAFETPVSLMHWDTERLRPRARQTSDKCHGPLEPLILPISQSPT